MPSEKPVEGHSEGLVAAATRAELERLGAAQSFEGARALNLAAVLDDRAGVQAGGVAATDKQLGLIMQAIRDSAPKRGDAVDDVLAAARAKRAGRSADPSGVQRTTKRRNVRG